MPMVIAAVGNTPYNIFVVLHVLTALAAFAPLFIYPFLANQMTGLPGEQRSTMWGYLVRNSRRIHAPALILTGVFGFGLSGMSGGPGDAEQVYPLTQTWLIVSILLWLAMNGILHAVLVPAERALAGGDDSAKSRIDTFGPIMALLLVVVIYLMVFKPGA